MAIFNSYVSLPGYPRNSTWPENHPLSLMISMITTTGMCHGGLIDSREFGAMVSFSIGILVGGLEQLTHIFHILGILIPTDEFIFFRGVGQPPTGIFFMANKGCPLRDGWAYHIQASFDGVGIKKSWLLVWVRCGSERYLKVPSLYGASWRYDF